MPSPSESSTSSNESSDSHFDQAEVDDQQQVVMDDYEPEYEGNYHSHSGGWDDSRSNYGFDGGCYGFSTRDCDDLLDQGIKPWDDDADAALGAMRGW